MNTRQQDIVVLVKKEGEITIKELAQRLSVSEMTIHRDLDYLQEQRFLYKKRGAAVFVNDVDRVKYSFYAEEKRAIGKKLASMLKPGQSILFDNSTIALECAKFIDPDVKYTFYTTGMEAAQILSSYTNSILYSSGGYYCQESRGFVGTQTERFVESIHADVCIIGASGISLEGGITTAYPIHKALEQKIIASSALCLLGADHSKFDKTAMEKVSELADVDVIVTDSGIFEDTLKKYKEKVNIITV